MDELVALLRQQLAAREQDVRELRQELREVRREHRRELRGIRQQHAQQLQLDRDQRGREIEQRDREIEQRGRQREEDVQRGERLERLIIGMRNDLYGMQGEFRQTHNALRACAGQAAQLSNVLTETHARAIVDPLRADLQPSIVLMDVSDCPSQRRIYDSDNRYPSVIKLIEGQTGRHVRTTVNELTEEGGRVLGRVDYQPNGIPYRHHVKRAIEERLDGVSSS